MRMWFEMVKSPLLIKTLIGEGETLIDIQESNNNSPIIKRINEAITNPRNERFYDFLLEKIDALKLMSSALVDLKDPESNLPIILSSSAIEKIDWDGIKSLRELSERSRYGLKEELRNLSDIVKPYQQMLTSGARPVTPAELKLMQDQQKEIAFRVNDLTMISIDGEVNHGFLTRDNLIKLTGIPWNIYQEIISILLKIHICSVFNHICWCTIHPDSPYATLIHGCDQIGEILCPSCKKPLNSMQFVMVNPEYEPLLRTYGGFLPLLCGWYLTKSGYEWTADVTFNKHEYGDIIIKLKGKYYLIECKAWSREINKRGISGNISKSLTQAIAHIKYWETQKIKIEKTVIITNVIFNENFETGLKEAFDENAEEINGVNIQVSPIKLIHDIISELIAQ